MVLRPWTLERGARCSIQQRNLLLNDLKRLKSYKTTIYYNTYSINHYSKVKIDIYSIDGKIISNLVNSYQSHGLYTANWTPKNITAGIYFVKMRVGLFSDTKKIIYIK